ncbi:hypothetical protein P168DRAFT_278878 [Aspergillus campestris IBT 28561]|uniref:BTB domain-containing protein n=1 Tax=Aspergillus campestris (strain IBT 28561) TaxID=1392248 RepID=A0A2I1DHP7_ASPC2|nr:uncharacterized protein P168DRAFT_278878 [Aspergillus campestris IBT 28561]PKY09389.1 hypothetical protein P168DRAFT_278878 [Aspergillus campestris IBT 28561]
MYPSSCLGLICATSISNWSSNSYVDLTPPRCITKSSTDYTAMEKPSHAIDPNGEVVFALPKRVPLFTPWPQECIAIPKSASGRYTTNNDPPNDEGNPTPEPKGDDPELPHYTVQVSAKHLAFASPVLKKCLTGPWKEGQSLFENFYVKLDAGDWDFEAFLLFMNIVHCKTHRLTRDISVTCLAQLATIAGYYDSVLPVKFFADIWIDTLIPSFPTTHCREVMLWLCISCIFNRQALLRKAANLAITRSNEPLTSLGLSLPTTLLREPQLPISSIITS